MFESLANFKQNLPHSKKQFALLIFALWNAGYPQLELYSASEIFSLMIRIYDQSDEKIRKVLDEKFKTSLHGLDEERASHWLMVDGLTEGLGNHLAKCRARAGGFQLALRDVKNANFLPSGIDHLTARAILEATKVYDALCRWDKHVVMFCDFLKKDFAEIEYQCVSAAKYDCSRSSLVVTLFISPMKNCPAISASALIKFIDRKLPGKIKECFRTSDELNWPNDISVEVFLGPDRIAQITV